MSRKMKKLLLITGIALLMGAFLQFSFINREFSESVISVQEAYPPFIGDTSQWTDSVFNTLSRKERLGQMLMIPAYPRDGEEDKERVAYLIKKYQVGGIIFFQGTPKQVHELANYYQSISKVPLLIAIDGEWGANMRLSETIKYPKQMTLGAISSDMLIYQMGQDIAEQLKHLGIHVNFAPVVDINNNPENPVINSRSFGEHRVNVARKGLLYMKGMQDAGVLAFAKHFPGHGDTKTDSHLGLPVIPHSRERLDSLELYPFRALIHAGVGGVMMAHMHIPALDSSRNRPSTLSPYIADTMLQQQLGFKGLVVTDAMNMKGVANHYKPVEANLLAIKAGNDILLMPHEVAKTFDAVQKALKRDTTLERKINSSCRKVLAAKNWAFKNAESVPFLSDSMNNPIHIHHRDILLEAAITMVKNDNDLVPLKRLDTLKIASVSFGPSPTLEYDETLKLYAKVDKFSFSSFNDSIEVAQFKQKLEGYNLVLLSLHSNYLNAGKKFNFKHEEIRFTDELLAEFPVVLIGLSNPYVLAWLENLESSKSILIGYENSGTLQSYMVQAMFGAKGISGRLPVSINNKYSAGAGLHSIPLDRLSYVTPVEAGFDPRKLEVIDSIIEDAIAEKAIPGCQVLAAKDGQVFFYKTFGYHTYRKKIKVKKTDLYDLASITKIAATVPSLIRLQNEKQFNPEKKLSDYIYYLDTCAKGDIKTKDVLLHQAGLAAWIPFYRATIEPIYPSQDLFSTKQSNRYPFQIGRRAYANKHIKYRDQYFSSELSDTFTNKVAESLYMNKMFEDSIWHKIAATELGEPGEYRYSDLGFYLFYKIVESQSGVPFDRYTDSVFYSSLGAYSLGFQPLNRFSENEIVPTENDVVFRKQIVHGYVHDPGAAMLGGVSGHAGLFSSANDLAKLMQMFLNEGRYGGEYYLNRKTIRKYTDCPSCETGNRRGLGFDKPQPDTSLPGPAFKGISTESYGHTGFTGTMAWVDPSTGIQYIFLSNRVYPDALNFKLVKMNVRTKVQEAIYKAML
jgi:beta-glucosidase-like glycosyl hydrolase/CubicO group peptidase (beta-lactamase class C family)